MLILRGAPALSQFRTQKLLKEGQKSVSNLGQIYAEYVHFADLSQDLSDETVT